MLASSSWAALVGNGRERFVSQIAELYFIVLLNMAQAQITMPQRSEQDAHVCGFLGKDALEYAVKSLKRGHWMDGYRYRPAGKLLAKLAYSFALVIRLQADLGGSDRALRYIDRALGLLPGDAAILQERNNIRAWMARGY
jgi:hypothetical protein